MTERFTHKEDDWEIFDNGEHLAFAHSDYQAEKICELLNELHEEVQSQSIVIKGYQERNDELFQENEELKQQWKEKRHEDINELSVIAMKYKALEKENERLRRCINEIYTIARLEEV